MVDWFRNRRWNPATQALKRAMENSHQKWASLFTRSLVFRLGSVSDVFPGSRRSEIQPLQKPPKHVDNNGKTIETSLENNGQPVV